MMSAFNKLVMLNLVLYSNLTFASYQEMFYFLKNQIKI
jgi:hypothetical protein